MMIRVYEKVQYLVHLGPDKEILKVEMHPCDVHIVKTGMYNAKAEQDTGDPPDEAKWTVITGDVSSYLVAEATKGKDKELLFYSWNEHELATEIIKALDTQQGVIEWVMEPEGDPDKDDADEGQCTGFEMNATATTSDCVAAGAFRCFHCVKIETCGFVEEEYQRWEAKTDGKGSATS